MDLCEQIFTFKQCAGNMAAKYVSLATYGNETPEQYYRLLSVNAMIRTLERQVTGKRTSKVKIPLQGQTVPFSSLKSVGNLLFLPSVQTVKCLTTDIRPCLTENQICEIIEKLTLICKEYDC